MDTSGFAFATAHMGGRGLVGDEGEVVVDWGRRGAKRDHGEKMVRQLEVNAAEERAALIHEKEHALVEQKLRLESLELCLPPLGRGRYASTTLVKSCVVNAYPCDSFGTPSPQETALCTLAGDQRIQHTLRDTHPDSPELTSEEWDPLSLAEPPEPLCICTTSALPPCA
ncbi:hypothetical protein CYMTET_39754 [Cymbomonas tetramitiformis]|uniref:Uncharacterized protein n=1 Tax=Cymbomonas tetramitiformis TaxID=36881 RepID=A0AAE0F4D0_9CHLO|nr:hypothetical protein CYMTET_39754 [Cymbomonas tetramitiformis]